MFGKNKGQLRDTFHTGMWIMIGFLALLLIIYVTMTLVQGNAAWRIKIG